MRPAGDTAGTRAGHLAGIYPALMIGIFFLIPFALMLAVSVAHRVPDGFYEFAFEADNYRRIFEPVYLRTTLFSVGIAALVAAICIAIGFPFTYHLTRLPRRAQVLWLIFILAVLSLSEVLIAFCWQVLLSRTAGIGNVAVWLGLVERASSFYPSFGAVVLALVYLVLPYSVLVLYPPLSRLEPEIPEAARMLGASPLRTFFGTVVPVMRPAITAAAIMIFVFTIGAYLIPQVLGKPEHWTLSVLITDQAVFNANMPFAAALASFLMAITVVLVMAVLWLERRQEAA
ncbi:ABC transporter permease [Oceanibacterium hippocampi]|uniref:Spermidine/putrescine transport system permease protein PotB n=1 Tax=Oceanibacterium hippocampi TaxID=745714 RepID=A0A1Y5R7R9_9PROT|nr:ABC transporter permease [Oceanibacterium hippocampi]SLN11109.1 Spermidine/putrescine transport system permease protein PotB [Oceanibacterium hippocampi]